MTGEVIIVGVISIAATTLVQAAVGYGFRLAVVQVREKNVALEAQIKALEDNRIARLEAKDERDTKSRSDMHKDVDRLNIIVTELKALFTGHTQVQAMIKSEIDRSIASGNERVKTLETRLDAMQRAWTEDVNKIMERLP